MSPIVAHIKKQARKLLRTLPEGAPWKIFLGKWVYDLMIESDDRLPADFPMGRIRDTRLPEFMLILDEKGKILDLSILGSDYKLHNVAYVGRQDGLYDGAWLDVARGYIERYNIKHKLKPLIFQPGSLNLAFGPELARPTIWSQILKDNLP